MRGARFVRRIKRAERKPNVDTGGKFRRGRQHTDDREIAISETKGGSFQTRPAFELLLPKTVTYHRDVFLYFLTHPKPPVNMVKTGLDFIKWDEFDHKLGKVPVEADRAHDDTPGLGGALPGH